MGFGQKGAIGYVSIGTAEYNSKTGVPIRLLSLNGVEASVKTVASLKFPLSRKLILVTKPSISPLAKKFIEFAQSSEVSTLVKKQYFVPAN